MHRRDFMKLAAAAGLTVMPPRQAARAGGEMAPGPYWMTINLRGGWDTTLFCDPRGADHAVEGAPLDQNDEPIGVNRAFTSDQILTRPAHVTCTDDPDDNCEQGLLRLGPDRGPDGALLYGHGLYGQPNVLDALADPGFTIINGIDAGLTSHAQGERQAMSGALDRGAPTLGSLIARHQLDGGAEMPIPLLSFGGYDSTGELVAPTRLTRFEVLDKITKPNLSLDDAAGPRFHETHSKNAIDEMVARRMQRQRDRATTLPRHARALAQLHDVRLRRHQLRRFAETFEHAVFDAPTRDFIQRQIYVSLLSFREGLAASAGLTINGWDTHHDNDRDQSRLLRQLFGALIFLRHQAARMGVLDRLNVVVLSEFGRTPTYNRFNGKDHHSVSSWMTMLWGSGLEDGIRVVGGTDADMLARPMTEGAEFATLAPGVKLSPAIVHNELRHVAGLAGEPVLTGFELPVPRVRIWG